MDSPRRLGHDRRAERSPASIIASRKPCCNPLAARGRLGLMKAPKLIMRRAPRGERDIFVNGSDIEIGNIVPEMNADGSPTVEYHGRVRLKGKQVNDYASDTRRISGVVGSSPEHVLATLQSMADEFYSSD